MIISHSLAYFGFPVCVIYAEFGEVRKNTSAFRGDGTAISCQQPSVQRGKTTPNKILPVSHA